MGRKLIADIALSRPLNAVAAGTTDQTGSAVDMQGFDGCLFIAPLGALTANQVTKLKAQSSNDDGATDAYADIPGAVTAAAVDADGNKMLVLDVHKPKERYLKPVVDRETANAVLDGVIAIRYGAKSIPTTHLNVSQLASVSGA